MNEAFKQETLSTIGKENGNKGISYQALEKMMSESKNLSENDRVDYKKLFKKVLNEFKPDYVVFHYPNPFVGSILPSNIFKKVLLPAPLAPIIP